MVRFFSGISLTDALGVFLFQWGLGLLGYGRSPEKQVRERGAAHPPCILSEANVCGTGVPMWGRSETPSDAEECSLTHPRHAISATPPSYRPLRACSVIIPKYKPASLTVFLLPFFGSHVIG